MSQKNPPVLSHSTILALILISMVGPLAMNIILPSISSYQVAFETEYALAQLTLTFYLASVAIGQLFYGPISDRFGRMPVIYFGLVTYVIGGALCYFAQSIEMLIVARIIQAFGGCAGMVMGRAMVRDKYDANQATSVIAYMTMGIVLAPTLGPAIGGILEDLYGWQSSFIFVALCGLTVFFVVTRSLSETLPREKRHPTHIGHMLLSFYFLFRNPKFNAYAFMVAFSTSAYFAFLGGSSYVLIDLMGISASELGLAFVAVSALYILGNFLTARLNIRFGLNKLIAFGATVSLLGALAILMVDQLVGLNPYTFIGLMSFIAFGNGFCISTGLAAAVGADPARVGAASGLAGSLQIGMGSIATFIVGTLFSLFPGSVAPLAMTIVGCCTLAAISFGLGLWINRRAD
ncbi:multidrug effflux MFS transporter [Sneathiella limimaris]|uniref:multidrug effflux MFS transporter n=1 Tax=Sneathiella limimaris TaxID=1964213 RepID=UPI00146ACC90|nr:multidrug effflux MFS transporter [Sneathiella limimaris]